MIYYIIESIKNEPTSTGKFNILKEHQYNDELKQILEYTYSPLINYYTRHQVQEYRHNEMVQDGSELELGHIFLVLNMLLNRTVTGNKAIDCLNELAIELRYLDRIILNKIINRDLDCGIGIKTINKVWPNLIPVVPYMRCSLTNMKHKIKYPAVVQQKCDGMFVNVVYRDGSIKFYTRNGTEFDLNCLKHELSHTLQTIPKEWNIVLHGELLVAGDEGTVESRKTGNGLIVSLIKKDQVLQSLHEKLQLANIGKTQAKISSEITKKMAEYESTDNRLKLVIWDMVSYDDWTIGVSDIPYTERFNSLKQFTSEHVSIVDTKEVKSYEEALEFYKDQIAQGFEGGVLKNWNMKWKNHTSPEQIKLKAERECELLVVGYVPGTGENLGGIGSLSCVSSDSKLKVDVPGLTKEMRGIERVDDIDSSKGWKPIDGFDCNCYNGKIITVKFNEVISSEGKDTYSLFLPRFIEIREDKDEADSFETIKNL